ncbi:MAG: transposase [Proteobacteria bacterium]|nr:transposase [Pseudomonadota bacterium]
MPRRPRLELPGSALHITHRGVNRGATFIDDDDFARYRQLLHIAFGDAGIALHAYVLMTNHVHFLLTPPAPGCLSRAMSRLGQRYVPWFNHQHRRTGTLWEGRFKSCLVDTSGYLARVHRYIELNPVRAAMVDAPERYRWSSVHANLGACKDPLVTPHPAYLGAISDPDLRALSHRQWLQEGISEDDLAAIRAHMQQERALGSLRFQSMVEKTLNRPATVRPRGRPPLAERREI